MEQWLEALTSGDDGKAEEAVRHLAQLGEAALPDLQALLHSAEPDRRWWAARALAAIPGPAPLGLLIAALQDPDASVRQCAALGLRQRPDPQAIPALVGLLRGSDALCVSLAADALAHMGKAATPALIEVLSGPPHPARAEATRALALIGDTSSIPALFKALDDDSLLVQHWANQGLERMGVGMSFFKP